LKVKATKDFNFYRLAVMKVPAKDKPNEFIVEMSLEDFRALQHGEIVDIDERLYKRYRNCFKPIKPPAKDKGGK